jgi:hypothetical protein
VLHYQALLEEVAGEAGNYRVLGDFSRYYMI